LYVNLNTFYYLLKNEVEFNLTNREFWRITLWSFPMKNSKFTEQPPQRRLRMPSTQNLSPHCSVSSLTWPGPAPWREDWRVEIKMRPEGAWNTD